jgi:hypothetical protein
VRGQTINGYSGVGHAEAERGVMTSDGHVSRLLPWAVGLGLVLAVAAGLVFGFEVAGLLLAGLLTCCAVARLTLPLRVVGLLAVRSRGLDVLMLAALATGVAVLAVTAPST